MPLLLSFISLSLLKALLLLAHPAETKGNCLVHSGLAKEKLHSTFLTTVMWEAEMCVGGVNS